MQPGKDNTGHGRWGWTKLKGKGRVVVVSIYKDYQPMQITWTINNAPTKP